MKLARGEVLVVASHNPGKLREIVELLAPFDLTIKGAAELGLPEPEETGATFAENAALKAHAAARGERFRRLIGRFRLGRHGTGWRAGHLFRALGGTPKGFLSRNGASRKALKEKNATDFSAKFVCALALARPNTDAEIFQGEVTGHLVFPPRGTRGFGYDPIFVAEGMQQTFGEIDPAVKHAMSHRARAFAKLKRQLEIGT
jgi:XTP/dITP diphosphohydrolase